jgi:hypothetical protein
MGVRGFTQPIIQQGEGCRICGRGCLVFDCRDQSGQAFQIRPVPQMSRLNHHCRRPGRLIRPKVRPWQYRQNDPSTNPKRHIALNLTISIPCGSARFTSSSSTACRKKRTDLFSSILSWSALLPVSNPPPNDCFYFIAKSLGSSQLPALQRLTDQRPLTRRYRTLHEFPVALKKIQHPTPFLLGIILQCRHRCAPLRLAPIPFQMRRVVSVTALARLQTQGLFAKPFGLVPFPKRANFNCTGCINLILMQASPLPTGVGLMHYWRTTW